MNKMRMIKIRRLLYIIIIILELLFFGYLKLNEYFLHHLSNYTSTIPDDGIISFSIEPGIYDHSIIVDLKNELGLIDKDVKILYSLDGNDPYYNNSYLSEEKETIVFNPYEYSESIKIDVKEKDIVVVPIKAVVYYNGQYSKVVEKTYIVSDGDINQYTDLPIISITANHHDLYDYYDGIMVKGYLGDKFVEEGNEGINWGNIDLERQISVNVSFFKIYDNYNYYSNSNFQVTGGTSRLSANNKSFKISSNDNNYMVDFNYSNITNYKSLKLRSGSQDYWNTNIRASLANRIGYYYNFDGTPNSKRTILYINGNFYTIIDLMDNNSDSNLKSKYGLPDKKIEEVREVCDIFINSGYDDFNAYVKENFDVENLILYTAIELYMDNTDWPLNNAYMWKYNGKSNSINKYTDGKYRFILKDLDITWRPEWFQYEFDSMENIITKSNRGKCDFFNRLLVDSEYKQAVIDKLYQIISELTESGMIYNFIDEEYNIISKSSRFYLKNNENLLLNINMLKERIANRKNTIDEVINRYYNNL